MTITPPSADALEYLESLMRAGRDAMKQFDDALASVAGVRDKEANSLGPLSPIGLGTPLFYRHLPVVRIRTPCWREEISASRTKHGTRCLTMT